MTLPTNPQKARRGFTRLWYAAGYSLAGVRSAWFEPAFRQECIALAILFPLSIWLGSGWVEITLLYGSALLVAIIELLNTAIETVVDRIGPEWNILSKRAKDLGSAAVFLMTMLTIAIWCAAVWSRVFS